MVCVDLLILCRKQRMGVSDGLGDIPSTNDDPTNDSTAMLPMEEIYKHITLLIYCAYNETEG